MAWEIYLNKVLTESGLVLIHIIMMSCMNLKFLLCGIAIGLLTGSAWAVNYTPEQVNAHISLKAPGNKAKQYPLILKRTQNDNAAYQLVASENIPLTISQRSRKLMGVYILTCVLQLWRMCTLTMDRMCLPVSVTMIACFTCPDFGIAVICARPKKLLHSIHLIVG